jgi:hypothetical protein
MPWMDWGIVGGIISLVALLLFSILTLYARPTGSSPPGKRLGGSAKPEPLVERRAA